MKTTIWIRKEHEAKWIAEPKKSELVNDLLTLKYGIKKSNRYNAFLPSVESDPASTPQNRKDEK